MKKLTKLLKTTCVMRPQKLSWLVVLLMTVFGINTTVAQIALRSSQTNTSTSTSVTITKPSNLAVGDLMLANIVQNEDSNSQSLSNATATGWTLVAGEQFGSSGNNTWWGTIFYKVATAADVAATNFTFTGDTDADDIQGGIAAFSGVAVTGGVSGGPFDVVPGSINNISTDDLSAPSITTATAGAAVIMIGMIGDNRSIDSWTATSPSSLTEIFDVPFNSTLDMGIGMAWALKATAGATGNGAGELSANENDPNGAMFLALRPCTANPTVTPVASILPVCFSNSAQTTTMPYSASTNSPTSYSIDWNAAANTAGLLDQDVTTHTFVGAGGIMPNVDIDASVAAGTYNGTLSIITAGGCRNTVAVSVTILAAPTANAGSALTAICQGGTSAALGGSVGGSATGGTWSDGGVGGTFLPNATTLNATWTPPSEYSGTATLTLTTSGGACGTTTVTKNQAVNLAPIALAGGSQTICVSGTATVSGASATNGTILWSENGSGSITSGGTSLTPTYTSVAGDSGNTVTLTMTVSNAGCTADTDTYTITVNPSATVDAGATQTICATTPNVQLAGVIGGSATSAIWSGGTGTFSPDNTALDAIYTPSEAEFLAGGNVVLTLTTNDPDGPCNAVSDTMTITIKLVPIASAGGTTTICPGLTTQVSGASAANGTISWSEDGAGSITAGGSGLTPTYTSAAGDAGNTVTLTMTVTNSPCDIATATYTVVVSPAAPAVAGAITGSTSVCAGGTSLTYSVDAVTNATDYTWSVPSGWIITDGQGTTSITATAGGAGTGSISVVASNSCGNSTTQTISIFPVNATNNSGYTTSSTKTSNGIQCNNSFGERRGFVKFPLTTIPTGATIVSASLSLVNNASGTSSAANNDVKPLGNTDPTIATASTLFTAIGAQNSGTFYSRTPWSNTGTVTLTLGANAITDIQARFDNEAYIAIGLARGGSAVYNFFGYSSGANAPKLDITYNLTSELSVTINPLTTNGSLTTSACDTYTWAENGQTYTSSGVYTNVVGCNTATLNLTITPSTTNGDLTASACDSFTWSENGQTYTSTGIYTHVVGCNTATLDLTITPSTTIGSLTTSVCDTYTWAENGQTYTSSGVYTHVVGCNTATLDLTITPSTTNGDVTTSACDAYTWSENGQTYTSTGVYTHVSGCNTATLDLTITPSTTVGSLTTSACDSYTWSENGQTYTTSGVYTHVVGCNTATLDLTITPSTTDGSLTTSACDSYTWSENGQTYTSTGVYTHVVGCNTSTLDLTITPSTTDGSITETACISYTWTENGQTYTSSGIYTHVVGCNTATLNLTVNTTPETFYADTDGDGFGSGDAILSCTGQPENTSVNNTDCAPADPLNWRKNNLFIDADGDGYNNGFPAMPVCYGATIPSGYVAINIGTDCGDDNNAMQNPNASEVLDNGIDDNCDGVVDEVTPTSYLIASSCNTTLENLSNTLFAYQMNNFINELGPVQGYRFRVTQGLNVRTLDSSVSRFSLTSLPGGVEYATVYTVEVSVKSGGHYRAYGSPCTVTTPAVPNGTYIINPISGSTLTDISNTIFCRMVPSASGYRFRVSDGNTLIGTYSSHTNRFNLVNLGISNIAFGTTYSIDVLLKFGSEWRPDSEYGPIAQITTPATPSTSRVISPSCGTVISNFWTTIFAQQVIGAQGYKFVVTDGVQSREFITPNSRFNLRSLVGGAAPNTAYTIRVDVLYNNSYVEGVTTCVISTASNAVRQTASIIDIYEVKAYPNPYADTFKLEVNTSSEDQVGIRIFDMLGREVEARQTSVSNITNLEIGSQYPSGVYNIIVTQGDNVKTIRIIKR